MALALPKLLLRGSVETTGRCPIVIFSSFSFLSFSSFLLDLLGLLAICSHSLFLLASLRKRDCASLDLRLWRLCCVIYCVCVFGDLIFERSLVRFTLKIKKLKIMLLSGTC